MSRLKSSPSAVGTAIFVSTRFRRSGCIFVAASPSLGNRRLRLSLDDLDRSLARMIIARRRAAAASAGVHTTATPTAPARAGWEEVGEVAKADGKAFRCPSLAGAVAAASLEGAGAFFSEVRRGRAALAWAAAPARALWPRGVSAARRGFCLRFAVPAFRRREAGASSKICSIGGLGRLRRVETYFRTNSSVYYRVKAPKATE